jgi:hypothetical protein
MFLKAEVAMMKSAEGAKHPHSLATYFRAYTVTGQN